MLHSLDLTLLVKPEAKTDWWTEESIIMHAGFVAFIVDFFFFLSNKTWIILVYKKWVVVKMSFRGSCSSKVISPKPKDTEITEI